MICVWDSSSPLICFMTVTCYNKLIEQHHLMKTSSMQSKYGIQEQNGTNDQWALSSPFCPHILKQKGCLHHPFDRNRVQSRSTRWYNFRRWSLAREWNLELFLQPLLLLSCRNHPTFFGLCYYIVKSGEDRQQNMLCSVPFYYYGMYVYVGWEKE